MVSSVAAVTLAAWRLAGCRGNHQAAKAIKTAGTPIPMPAPRAILLEVLSPEPEPGVTELVLPLGEVLVDSVLDIGEL
jgi:hypothetical protein